VSLEGRVAVVTGGNAGIGKAITLALAEEGARLVIDFVAHQNATEELEQRIQALGDKVVGFDADVSKFADLEKLVGTVVKSFGRLVMPGL
jgi:glucose 1-dehydrogenase